MRELVENLLITALTLATGSFFVFSLGLLAGVVSPAFCALLEASFVSSLGGSSFDDSGVARSTDALLCLGLLGGGESDRHQIY